ncbi:MAG: hypothetical protein KME01_04400 [Chroococcus sp. CMT-3BRIN-NPC107]|jgi:hypothetical protein|nr:hypothetical protein [Chroococcus sp. CMT-3BRIN-NPC107]
MKLALQLNCLPKEAVVNWQQAKDFFTTTTSKFQAATEDFTNTSSETVQKAIAQARPVTGFASSVTNWLQAHPVIFRIFNSIIWAVDRPILSLGIIILTIAASLSIFKALNRLLEMVGLSLLKAPFKLIESGFKLGQLGIQHVLTENNTSDSDARIVAAQNSQQRLAEISQRIQMLQKEQNELLREAATILALDEN